MVILAVLQFLVFHAGIAAGVGIAFRRVCLSVCLSVCPRSNRKTVRAINTKLGTGILYSSRLACIDPEVKRSKIKVTRCKNRHCCTVLVTMAGIPHTVHIYAAVVRATVAGVGLHVDTTAYVF